MIGFPLSYPTMLNGPVQAHFLCQENPNLGRNWQTLLPATINIELPPTPPFPKIAIHRMDIEELATWVEDFSNFSRWSEAEMYAEFFRRKGIDGAKIVQLNSKDLRDDLGISKLGHRLELLRTIKELYTNPRARCAEQMERWHQIVSSYSDSEWSVASFDNSPNSAPEPDSSSGRQLQGNIPLGSYWSDGDGEDYTRHSLRTTLKACETNKSLKPIAGVGRKTNRKTASDITKGQEISDQEEY